MVRVKGSRKQHAVEDVGEVFVKFKCGVRVFVSSVEDGEGELCWGCFGADTSGGGGGSDEKDVDSFEGN